MGTAAVNTLKLEQLHQLVITLVLFTFGSTDSSSISGTAELSVISNEWFRKISGDDIPIERNTSVNYSPQGYMKELFRAIQENPLVNVDQSVHPKIRFTNVDLGKRNKRKYRKRIEFDNRRSLGRSISYSEIVLNESTLTKALIAKVTTKNGRRGRVAARHFGDFLIFNISAFVNASTTRIKCRFYQLSPVQVPSSNQTGLSVKRVAVNVEKEPILVTYEYRKENPLLIQSRTRQKRFMIWDRPASSGRERVSSWAPDHCKRYSWTINMELFNFHWYLHPMRYDAGVCFGACPIPFESEVLNTTNYAFMKNLYHANTEGMDESVPYACCTPIEYVSMPVYYINSNEEPIIADIPNMIVTACGCR